jgi:hypothetical protein
MNRRERINHLRRTAMSQLPLDFLPQATATLINKLVSMIRKHRKLALALLYTTVALCSTSQAQRKYLILPVIKRYG